MIEIKGKLISLEVIENQFVCNLKACQGACCIEGEAGAPLEGAELKEIALNLQSIKEHLDEEGKSIIENKLADITSPGKWATPLKSDGACAYSTRDEIGILRCGIEQAFLENKSNFLKPISCHLYPIRVNKNNDSDWEALNYDRWDICSAACTNGEKLKVPVYKFLKNALIRKYGEEFYAELDEVAEAWLTTGS